MKTGVSFFTFGQDADIMEACAQSAKAGYDGVELVLSESGSLPMGITERELVALRRRIGDMGLSVCSVGAWNLWQYNMAGEDPHAASHARDIVRKQIECASLLGADTVLVVPGWVGTNFAPGVVSYDVAYDNASRALGELAPFAAAARVAIGVENVWNKFLLSPLEFRRFLDEIGSPWVGAYFDVGNIIYIGYPEQWLRILGKKHVKKVHFCDCRGDQAGLGMFVDLLEGDVDFAAVMGALRDIGYDDWLTVEFLPNYKRFPYQSIINARL
ncbi:MAG TPA: sugar phosphate isomerase/epimerase family protein, partial [Candidatus Limnocylindria bacterium]|nr:sugar phosphate isomerase/epimerase family protein [Candidatus Limnocylindria bacterium]